MDRVAATGGAAPYLAHMTDITLSSEDGHEFSVHRADPEGPPRGGIVVIQEIFGVNAHIRAVTDRLAAAGYLAMAPALFDRLERGVELGYDPEGTKKGVELAWNRLPINTALVDLSTTAEALGRELGGAQRVGAVGFCFGGMLTAALASRRPAHLACGVAYYPSRAAKLLKRDVPGRPLMIHLGDKDQGVTVADGLELAKRWPAAAIHRYPEAGHGFNCDLRPTFAPDAAAKAWDRTLRFFDQRLARP